MANNTRFVNTITYNKHLTFDDRLVIQSYIIKNDHHFLKDIALFLKKDPSTISKEVKNNRILKKPNNNFRSSNTICLNFSKCTNFNLCSYCSLKFALCKSCPKCTSICKSFEKTYCPRLLSFPWVCNGCNRHNKCNLEKYYYFGKDAHSKYTHTLSSSREGISLSPDEFNALDELVTPLVKKHQSIAHIIKTNGITLSEKTIYNYIDKGFLSVKNIDLPKKLSYKSRQKHKPLILKDRKIREGRLYSDFTLIQPDNPSYVEMDTVEGVKGGNMLLTLHFVSYHFMIAFLIKSKHPSNITKVFDMLEEKLTLPVFQKLFAIILTDRGTEFSDPLSLEINKNAQLRSKIFFCDPRASYQKGSIERNHSFIRHYFPKGTPFRNITQLDLDLMLSHINSYARESLNFKTPYDVFFYFNNPQILEVLNIKKIKPNDIILKSSLFKNR